MTAPFSILLVEDNLGDARLIEEMLHDGDRGPGDRRIGGNGDVRPIDIDHVETLGAGIDAVDDSEIDLILLDLNLPDSTGMETVETMLDTAQEIPVVVLTGVPESELGTRAVGTGAQDYLVKDNVTTDTLVRTIRYAVERKETERELRTTRDQLAVLNRLMRHDIRNDLSIVVGRASELSAHVDREGQELLSEVLVAGNHVLQLTRTIEDSVESITSGDEPVLTPVNVRSVLSAEIETARNLYDHGEIVVEGGIPAVEVRATGLLSSVFGNLISNAMLYNDADEPEVRIGVEVDEETDRVHVSIADNGPGISPHRADDLFDKPTGGTGGGTGTGLYIVDRLVDQFNGDVRLSTSGQGTTFVVTLEQA